MSLWTHLLGAPFVAAALWAFVKRYFPWLIEDLMFLKIFGTVMGQMNKMKAANEVLYDRYVGQFFNVHRIVCLYYCFFFRLQHQVKAIGERRFLLFEDETWTYQQILWWSNKCCRALRVIGLQPGDKVKLKLYVFHFNPKQFLVQALYFPTVSMYCRKSVLMLYLSRCN